MRQRLEVSEQPSLFDEPKLEPYNEDWLRTRWRELQFHPKTDDWRFALNVWQLLAGTKHWSDIQRHEIDALLWLLVSAQSYNDFTALALDEDTPFSTDVFSLLAETYSPLRDDEDAVVDAVLQRFFGYPLEAVEAFGLSDPRVTFFVDSWSDRMISEVAATRGQLKRVLREAIGADELILNFYRDPFGWAERLKGDALPGASEQSPLELPEAADRGELLRAVDKLFDVFI